MFHELDTFLKGSKKTVAFNLYTADIALLICEESLL